MVIDYESTKVSTTHPYFQALPSEEGFSSLDVTLGYYQDSIGEIREVALGKAWHHESI